MSLLAACALGLHLATLHTNNNNRQGINPGAWAMCDGWTAGAYRNSRDEPTAYAGFTRKVGPIDITAGIATGYGKPMPLVIPSVALGSVRIAVFPSYRSRSGGIHAMWQF